MTILFPMETFVEKTKITVKKIAGLAGISRSHLNNIILGHRGCSYNVAKKLEKITGANHEIWLSKNSVQIKTSLGFCGLSTDIEEKTVSLRNNIIRFGEKRKGKSAE